ncbi:3-hydroxyacyl-CoA dehydrogenase NAD-binding domain-containing protein [Fontivita pretiosa]|uniref:3-hydroxyacyl-CoA dehydrogenase NAD-binding domain-containing protein n=1 Tax=Fontivita pretiosa TaxID=2989684 RepID=UPI003D184B83
MSSAMLTELTNVRIESAEIDGRMLMTVWMDAAGKPLNTCSTAMLADLEAALEAIERMNPAGLVFASAKARSFNAGADLFEIRRMSDEQVGQYLQRGQALFNRIAALPMPTVAAINGDCLGGGFELALACRYRVAADETSISIGLPEIKLGLIPAWGGTTRLPRLIGLSRALPILLAGKTMPPRKALKGGLINEVVRAEALAAASRRLALHGAAAPKLSLVDRAAARFAAVRRRVFDRARAETLETSHGNYPAPLRLLEVIGIGYERGFGAGLDAERQALLDLVETPAGQNLLRLFFLRQAARKRAGEGLNARPQEVKHAAVIGGGTMGAGIACALIRAGIDVRLVEVSPAAVSAALGRVQKMLDDDVSAGRLDKLAARHVFNRLSPTTEWTGLELADFVVEAVLETMPAKREVFARLDRVVTPGAVLATNTSSLGVSEIAQATLHPERVIGLHFFNPVPKMPLVEVIRGKHSDDVSLATAVALAGKIGKTPVLANDAPGFIVNRVLIPYLAEALVVASQGVPITDIDRAMKQWGMPMGPFELLDEIGLDIAAHVLRELGKQWERPPGVEAAICEASNRKWLGTKTGVGFYLHAGAKPRHRRRPLKLVVNEELSRTLTGGAASGMEPEAIQWRLVLPMVNESARVLEERVVDSPETIDLAMVLGTGLAPFRGGIVKFAEDAGLEQIVDRLEQHSHRCGLRFEPAGLLRRAAAQGRSLSQILQTDREPNAAPQGNEHAAESALPRG